MDSSGSGSLTRFRSSCSHLKTGLGLEAPLPKWHTHAAVIFNLLNMGLSLVLSTHSAWIPPEWMLGGRQVGVGEREKERLRGNHSVFYNLSLEATYYLFCHILLVTQTNCSTTWEGTTQGFNQKAGIAAGQLRDWLQQNQEKERETKSNWHYLSPWNIHALDKSINDFLYFSCFELCFGLLPPKIFD